MDEIATEERIKEAVREAYGGVARRFFEESDTADAPHKAERAAMALRRASCCDPAEATPAVTARAGCCGPAETAPAGAARASCCGPAQGTVQAAGASRFYSGEELVDLPGSVTDASLGCGNPLAIADLQPGEVVLDLGSGGGIDCFLAAKKVGTEGRVIGLDMTPDMIKLARRNAKKIGVKNVDFRFGEMEDIPLPDSSVDVVISNCVINLSPDKDAVFHEAYRVLRPGGRISVSDIVIDGDLPQAIRSRLDAWTGCIAGALDETVYLDKILTAGFENVQVASRTLMSSDSIAEEDIQLLLAPPDGQVTEGNRRSVIPQEARALLEEAGISPQELARQVASIKVTARKPA